MTIADFRITFSQPSLNVCDSCIDALSCNDLPSQHRGEGHIILSHDGGYSNARLFPRDTDSRHVVAGMIVNLKIIVLNQLQPSSLPHV
jgi:hypothetical protein